LLENQWGIYLKGSTSVRFANNLCNKNIDSNFLDGGENEHFENQGNVKLAFKLLPSTKRALEIVGDRVSKLGAVSLFKVRDKLGELPEVVPVFRARSGLRLNGQGDHLG